MHLVLIHYPLRLVIDRHERVLSLTHLLITRLGLRRWLRNCRWWPIRVLEANPAVNLRVLSAGKYPCLLFSLRVFHDEGEVGLGQLHGLVVDLDNERVRLNVVYR